MARPEDMTTTVFILAQGQQSRMPGLSCRKQLLKVGGQPIIARTIGQVRRKEYPVYDRGRENLVTIDPIVVGWPDFARVVEQEYGCRLITLRYPGCCILDGLHGTDPHWSDGRTIFLLGDVVYSRAAIDTIFSCEKDVMFFGTTDLGRATGELFAYSMYGAAADITAELLMLVPCRRLRSERGQAGHLRNLLWIWMEYLGLRPDTPQDYSHELLTPISDWTNDLDTDKDVELLLPELNRHAWAERA